jgi:hypothetical protein
MLYDKGLVKRFSFVKPECSLCYNAISRMEVSDFGGKYGEKIKRIERAED